MTRAFSVFKLIEEKSLRRDQIKLECIKEASDVELAFREADEPGAQLVP